MKHLFFKRLLLLFSIIGLFVFASKPNKNFNVANQSKKELTFLIDTSKSKINWKCAHVGTLNFNSGYIKTHLNEVKEINLSIDVNSIKNTDIDNDLLQGTLENVLKSVEFFNSKKYPEARFESHLITKIKGNEYHIEGDFIIFDVGLCTNFNGTIEINKDSIVFNTEEIIIDRTHWGIYYLSRNNKYPKDEESGFVVSDTIILDAQTISNKTP